MKSLERSSQIYKVLVLGDNRVASSIVSALTENSKLKTHQAVNRLGHTHDIALITQHKSDFSAQSLETLFKAISPDLLISTVSGGSFDTQKRMVDLALQAGIIRFIPPEFGHDSLNEKIQERLPPHKEKYCLIEYLRQLSHEHGFQWAAVATGCLLDYGLVSGDLGFDIKWQSATIHGTGDEIFAASSGSWIGRVVVGMIEQWEAIANRYLYAAGTLTSMNEVVSVLQDAEGKTWEVGRGDVEECVREGKSRISKGFPDAGMFLLQRSVLYDQALDAFKPFIEQDAKDLLRLESEQVRDIVLPTCSSRKEHEGHDCGCS